MKWAPVIFKNSPLGASAKDDVHIVEAGTMNYEGSRNIGNFEMPVQPVVSFGGLDITPSVTLGLNVVWKLCILVDST